MESCLLSRVSEQQALHPGLIDNLPLMFPTTPTIKMNDVISSLLQYKADLCSSGDPTSPLYSPPSKIRRTCSSSSSNPTSPTFSTASSSALENLKNCNSRLVPVTRTLPSASYLDRPNSLLAASQQLSTASFIPTTSSLLQGNSNLVHSNNSLLSSTSSLLPNNSSLLSSNSSLLSTNNPLLPSNNPLLPSNMNPLLPSNNPLLPSNNPLLPGNASSLLARASSLLPSNHILSNKMLDLKKMEQSTMHKVPSPPTSSQTPGGGVNSSVKIFQTKQGYTLLICNGYRYSKISTSSNGKKVYWRCTLRSCKGKVHTDVGGGVVYESTHDHPPMAEEFLFSCHSNRLAKEARQIMRFDPLKSLKDEVPYSALESTPTFCKIKDRINIKKSSSPVQKMESEPISLKQAYPLPLSTPPLPTLKIEHLKEGTLSVNATTSGLLTELNTLRLTHHLCDVALCVNGTLIYAHRVVLAAASQYFRLLFLTNTKLLSYIELSGVDADSVELLVNFAYTGNLDINYNRVTDMLTAANLLHFTPVVDKCCDYLRSQVNPQNCIRVREYVALQGLTKLQAIVDKYICSNWCRVIEHDDIYDARPDTLLYLLGQDELQVLNEAEVYKVIIAWVRKSPLYRQFYVGELLRKVRLVQLNAQFLLDNIESEELVRQHRECEALLHQAKNHFLLPERDHGLEEYHFRKRKRKQNVCLLGSDKNRTVGYEYDTTRNTAWEICSTELNRTEYCLLNSADNLHIIGGLKSDGSYSGEISSYSLSTKTWTSSACQLKYPRSQACGVTVGSSLYIIGGKDTTGSTDAVEMLDTSTNTTTTLPPLPYPIAGAAACLVADSIFIFGGHTKDGGSDKVFVFNTSLKLWKSVSSIPEKMSSPTVLCNIDTLIYLLGDKQYRYNTVSDVWEEASTSDIPDQSRTLVATSIDGDMFAMRARQDKLYLDKLDGSTLAWTPCCSVDLPLTVQAMCPRPVQLP